MKNTVENFKLLCNIKQKIKEKVLRTFATDFNFSQNFRSLQPDVLDL